MTNFRFLFLSAALLAVGCATTPLPTFPPVTEDNESVLERRLKLARCLNAGDYRLYSASWCYFCNKQIELFGFAAPALGYVECAPLDGSDNPACDEAGIESFPTWILPDGRRLVGLQSLEKLSAVSGCPSP